jgi:hypothetical protein
MESLKDCHVRSVNEIPAAAAGLARQRFILTNSRALALGVFGVVLFVFIKIGGNSTNHVWFLSVFLVLAAGIVVNGFLTG